MKADVWRDPTDGEIILKDPSVKDSAPGSPWEKVGDVDIHVGLRPDPLRLARDRVQNVAGFVFMVCFVAVALSLTWVVVEGAFLR